MTAGPEIHLIEEGDWWVSRDIETGVASQGETRAEALDMLDEAVALHRGEVGRPVTDDDLREWGIDPDALEPGSKELPEFMR
ncbi:type II toxin-antitoxin system HicB family antitoxin [Haloglomus salinum]|jgi:predicted RNase H-like HicB family nuclease|uniref:type II toxin-antitoxin system HicB family antitoxin n=1 Tax=Haloglomus salinum TaxID=2962673 RepID=UPI0020C9681F|nr:type II toxin-antitoxin system HicB family antitoxin [Haloglomus salinum]